MRSFIIGPFRRQDQNRVAFEQATHLLSKAGHTPVNPLTFEEVQGKVIRSDDERASYGIVQLATCDAVYLLRGWWMERTGRMWRRYARQLRLTIMRQHREH